MNLRAMHYFPLPSELKASICLGHGGSTLLLNLQEGLDHGMQDCSCGKEKGDRGETVLWIALSNTDFYCLFLWFFLSYIKNPSLYNLTTSHSYIICIKSKKVLTIKIINWAVPDPHVDFRQPLNAVVDVCVCVCIDICNLFLERVIMGSQKIFHMGHKTKFKKSCCRNQIQRRLLCGEWLCFGKTIPRGSSVFILFF